MCIYWGYQCIYWQDVSLGQLYTDDADADTTNDNTTQWTEHDCMGSLPNEPKKVESYHKGWVKSRKLS